jgi:hypothetical protein
VRAEDSDTRLHDSTQISIRNTKICENEISLYPLLKIHKCRTLPIDWNVSFNGYSKPQMDFLSIVTNCEKQIPPYLLLCIVSFILSSACCSSKGQQEGSLLDSSYHMMLHHLSLPHKKVKEWSGNIGFACLLQIPKQYL